MIPKVSIIIPCYNMGDFVRDALDSVLNYPHQDIVEIIIVNDGSDDNGYTKNILDNLNAPNLEVIHQENKGLGAARNKGSHIAKAPYIIPLDADNKLRHNYIDKGILILDSEPDVCMVYGNNKKLGLRNDIVNVGSLNISKLLIKNYIDACVILRKKAWKSINGYDESMPIMGYEDWDLNLRLFFKGWKFYYLDEVCFDYRVREDSMLLNSNKNRTLLVDYMFSKPELQQAKLLRDRLVILQSCEKMQKRTIIRLALKIEKLLKYIFGKQND